MRLEDGVSSSPHGGLDADPASGAAHTSPDADAGWSRFAALCAALRLREGGGASLV